MLMRHERRKVLSSLGDLYKHDSASGGKGDVPGFRCGSGLRSGSRNFNFRELSDVGHGVRAFLLVSTCNLQIPPKTERGNIEFAALNL